MVKEQAAEEEKWIRSKIMSKGEEEEKEEEEEENG
jgi:hypothetical protein